MELVPAICDKPALILSWYNIATVQLPKNGNTPDECEDALRFVVQGSMERIRIAVSDGATECAFAGSWSNLLASLFANKPFTDDIGKIEAYLTLARKVWTLRISKKPLPWYAAMKVQDGAYATIVALEIQKEPRIWRALAVGDSCIFRISKNGVSAMLPDMKPEDFSSRPYLLSTQVQYNRELKDHLHVRESEWNEGDCFIAATDAFSNMLVAQRDKTSYLSDVVDKVKRSNQEDQKNWIAELRSSGIIKNDDIAVVVVSL